MRLLEICLVISGIGLMGLAGWSYWWRRLPWTAVATLVGLTAVIGQAHLLIEGYRWQMWGGYVLAVGGAVAIVAGTVPTWIRKRPSWRVLIGSGGGLVVMGILSLVVPVLLPVPKLAAPSGPYVVGTQTFYMVDGSREETHTEEPGDVRELMVQVWYPAAKQMGPEATYVDNALVTGAAVAEQFGLPSFLMNHINLAPTYTYVGAPVAQNGPFPVIVFVHGLSGVRGQNMFQVTELASQGYVVVAADHPYGNAATVYPDGRVAAHDSGLYVEGEVTAEKGRFLIDIWVEDVAFILDELERLNGMEGVITLDGQMDLERIGVMGHSTGGGTMWVFCQEDPRCDVGLGLDAWLRPISDYAATVEREVPTLFMSTETWLGEENMALGEELLGNLGDEGGWFMIADTNHYTFSDFPFLTPLSGQIGLTGDLPVERGAEIIKQYTVAFFDKHLKGEGDDELLEGANVYEEVEWR
ncbi:MAG TPA: dienelactone hydrolase family protein [Anaerolineae bacterium]|nr:dienelactone hydrolase family protein [Anaerolineae bacterium]